MSRRFGRNQRRRMREEIAHKQTALEMAIGLSDHLSGKLRYLNDFVEFVGDQVGRHAIAAGKPSTLAMNYKQKYFRLPVHQRMPSTIDLRGPIGTEEMKSEVMCLLEVAAVYKPMTHEMHVMVEVDGKMAGYAISKRALIGLHEQELTELIAPKLARLLVTAVKEAQ